ncbi:MAG TPA: hypothetical protein PKC55_07600 [Dysgonomonas sp.]|uniref:hypothetical protein n=1 Tax=unclassified Dysgonomonas TaxID=2630389 RepID=UPI0025C4842E|nr:MULTISPECIES: hypothetical protein [unclassified Dysgonomonas]HML64676.1 hypothetical protein [Dysgonomonas sp.]
MTLIVEVLDQFTSNVKGQKTALEVLEKLRNDLKGGISGLKVTCPPFSINEFYTTSELTTHEVDKILFVLNDKIEDLRDQIDDDVIAFEANDKDDSISDIIDHLSSGLETAKEAQQLESIHDNIVKQRAKAEQEENEKDKKIAELTAKVDTQQMALKGKDGEIASLKSERNSLAHDNSRLRDHLDSAKCCIGRFRAELEYRYRFDRPRPLSRGMF